MSKKRRGAPLHKKPKGVLSMEPRAVMFEDGSAHEPPPAGERWWRVTMDSPALQVLRASLHEQGNSQLAGLLGEGLCIFFCAPVDSDPDEMAAGMQGEVSDGTTVTVTPEPIVGWYTHDGEFVRNG